MALIELGDGQCRWHSLVEDFLHEINALALVDGPQFETQLRAAFCTLHFDYLHAHAHDYQRLYARQRNLLRAFDLAFAQGALALVHVNRFAPYLVARGLYQPARQLLTRSEQVHDQADPGEQIKFLVNIVRLDIRQGEYHAAEARLQQALRQAQAHGLTQYLGEVYQLWGIIAKSTGRYDQAQALNHKTLEFAREQQDQELISTTLANLGMTAIEQGQYATARNYLEESLAIAQRIDELKVVEYVYNALALIAIEGELDFAKTLDYLNQAQVIAQSLGRLERLAYIALNAGAAHYYLGQYDTAEDHLRQGLVIATELEHDDLRIRLTRYLGRIKAIQGDFLEAEQLFKLALTELLGAETTALYISVLSDLGKLYFQYHHLERAQKCFQEALAQTQALPGHDLTAEVMLGMGYVLAADHWLIGPGDTAKTVHLLTENWEPQLLAQLPRWLTSLEHLRKSAFFFDYGLINFPDIRRYRMVEALAVLAGLAEP